MLHLTKIAFAWVVRKHSDFHTICSKQDGQNLYYMCFITYISLLIILLQISRADRGLWLFGNFLHAGGQSWGQSAFKMFICGGLIEKEETLFCQNQGNEERTGIDLLRSHVAERSIEIKSYRERTKRVWTHVLCCWLCRMWHEFPVESE